MNKKSSIIKAATRLFASQGYDATTTLQVAMEIKVTEPSVYYYYKNKITLFNAILEEASRSYFKRIDGLDFTERDAFGCIESIVRLHFSVVADEPLHMRILLRSCPARLKDSEDKCTKIFREARFKLKDMFNNALERGISSGEFYELDVDATSNMLIAVLNGIMRQQMAAMDSLEGVEEATIQFCRNALVIKK